MKVIVSCGSIRRFRAADRLRGKWWKLGMANKIGESWEAPLRLSANSSVRMEHSYTEYRARKEDAVFEALFFLLKERIFGKIKNYMEVILPKEIFRLLSRHNLQRLFNECEIKKITVRY